MSRRFANRYDILNPIGQGGMGVVYDAVHTSTGRRVALKLLNVQGESLGEDVLPRFAREARAAGAISSKHIVQILDAGTDEETGAPFLAMERLEGMDLREAVRPLGTVPVELALRVVTQACMGLAKAHEAGVVHRDIKLGNLFLAEDDEEITVKILDFGIAKIVSAQANQANQGDGELTRTGTMIGSPQYMSPEQALGKKDLDGRSDLWSLGIVLYRLLTGRTPHQDTSAMGELIFKICSQPPAPVQDIAPWVPGPVARVVHRALRLRREDRYASAELMLAELRALLPDGCAIHKQMFAPIPDAEKAIAAPRIELTPDPANRADLLSTAGLGAPEAHESDKTVGGLGVTDETRRAAPPKKRARLVAAIAVAFVLGVGGIVGAGTLVHPAQARSDTKESSPQPVPDGPKVETVRVHVSPESSAVTVDDREAANTGGFVEIHGPLGSRHRVVLRSGARESVGDIVITQDGAFPNEVSLPTPPPVAATAPAPQASEKKATSAAPARKPAAPAPRTAAEKPAGGAPAAGFMIQKSFD